ncbi:MAG: type VI secretion system tube protein Hcp [Thermoproteota archaeon]
MQASPAPQELDFAAILAADAASVDYYLKIDGIEGESTDARHMGEIEVLSWSWGEANAGVASRAGGGGGGVGKVNMQDFHFTAVMSKASPKLFEACAAGQHIKEAVLIARKAGGDQQEYLKITLNDVLISSYQTGGSSGDGGIPVDSFSLNFAKIEFEYKPQKPDGSLDTPIKTGYDLKLNRKV